MQINTTYKILVINPGSTSTKVAVFENERKLLYANITHSDEELKEFSFVMEQRDFRARRVLEFLAENDCVLSDISCIMSRGGMLPPCPSGAYIIDDAMVSYMEHKTSDVHISNVGCAVALLLSKTDGLSIPAFIYDPVSVDELEAIARITGLPELPKVSRGHALNTHAMAHRCATEIVKKPISECNFIVQHIGGGCSVWLISHGKAIDMYSDDDAGFAPERCGKLQAMNLIKLCYSGKYTLAEMEKKVRGAAGLRAHLGTSDAREVEAMINSGDKHAELIYKAFAYGLSKGIGDLATVVCGNVDRIILTGGVAYSKLLTSMISERVSWIAPVEIMAGEYEMEALCFGGLRVLRGEEAALNFEF